MADKKNTELFGWLTGQWNRQLNTRSVTDSEKRKRSHKEKNSDKPPDWIDELEMYDAIFEDE